ncbi:hypothetical protein Fmac_023749 [Flemingia macrophylla]|uniref:Uncharacterized protein n=1 Tax=Flemingia macrophylla TaxID=520843 RepID=A0ABD1LMG8_9FABA
MAASSMYSESSSSESGQLVSSEKKLRNKSWIDVAWWDYKQRKTLWCWQSRICIEIGRCLPKFIFGRSTQGVEKILQLEQQVRQSREEARQSREEAR